MPTVADIAPVLEEALAHEQLLSYASLAAQFGLAPPGQSWQAHPFCALFEQLDQEDAQAGRPFRTSVVVNASTNYPGNGFFTTLQRLRGVPVPPNDRVVVWAREYQAAVAYYRHQ